MAAVQRRISAIEADQLKASYLTIAVPHRIYLDIWLEIMHAAGGSKLGTRCDSSFTP